MLAEISSNIAHDEMSRDLQDLLLKVHQAYWDVYLLRAALLQKRKLHWQAVQILEELNSRRDVDVLGNQLVRARAAVTTREAAMIRYQTEVQNAEARIRTLINDPGLMANGRPRTDSRPASQPFGYLNINLGESLGDGFCQSARDQSGQS